MKTVKLINNQKFNPIKILALFKKYFSVIALSVIGNVSVLIVLLSNQSEFTVPKLLVCNLAFADLCMGVYLFLIALIDLHSKDEYFNYAFDWQYGELLGNLHLHEFNL